MSIPTSHQPHDRTTIESNEKDSIVFSRKGNKNMCQYATYTAYNTSHETIILPKNQLVGQCQLILQPNKGAYQQELSAMRKERITENLEQEENTKEDKLSREWVMENFRLKDNPIIKANPEVGEELIKILGKKGQAFEGGATRDQVIGQGVAGRTDWIVARVELKAGEETPVNMKQ